LVFPRPGADYVAPGKKAKIANYFEVEDVGEKNKQKMVCWELGQKAQFEKLPHSYQLLSIVINRDFWLRFLLHKKALKSFLHPLTICDKVASGNNNFCLTFFLLINDI
jgi:hypothetical protein